MSYDIYFKKEIANQIGLILKDVFELDQILKKINVPSITVNQGLIEIGTYSIPVTHIIFIQEV